MDTTKQFTLYSLTYRPHIRALMQQGNYAEALAYTHEVFAKTQPQSPLAREPEMSVLRSLLLSQAALAHYYLGNFEQGLRDAAQAVHESNYTRTRHDLPSVTASCEAQNMHCQLLETLDMRPQAIRMTRNFANGIRHDVAAMTDPAVIEVLHDYEATALSNLSRMLKSDGQLDLALKEGEAALDLRAKAAKPNPFGFATSYKNVGDIMVQIAMQKGTRPLLDKGALLEQASRQLERAYGMRRVQYSPDHFKLAEMEESLALLAFAKGDKPKAQEHADAAYRMLLAHEGTKPKALGLVERLGAIRIKPFAAGGFASDQPAQVSNEKTR